MISPPPALPIPSCLPPFFFPCPRAKHILFLLFVLLLPNRILLSPPPPPFLPPSLPFRRESLSIFLVGGGLPPKDIFKRWGKQPPSSSSFPSHRRPSHPPSLLSTASPPPIHYVHAPALLPTATPNAFGCGRKIWFSWPRRRRKGTLGAIKKAGNGRSFVAERKGEGDGQGEMPGGILMRACGRYIDRRLAAAYTHTRWSLLPYATSLLALIYTIPEGEGRS